MRNLALALSVGVLALTASGCADEEGQEEVETEGKGDRSGFLGTYPVSTVIDIPDVAGLDKFGPALVELRAAGGNPGEAFLNAVAAEDLGLLSTVVANLPADVRATIVAKLNIVLEPVKHDIVALAAYLERLVAQVEIDSEIRIYERGRWTGITSEEHVITQVAFRVDDYQVEIDVEASDSGHGRISSSGEASLDDVDLELSLGSMLLDVAEEFVLPKFGATNLTELLLRLIDCEAVGREIANYVPFVDGAMRCREGLASLEQKVETALMMKIEVRDGYGYIAPGSGKITNGSWRWEMDIAGYELDLTLPFQSR